MAHRIGIKFIKVSIHFLKYDHLYNILALVDNEPDTKEKFAIIEIVNNEIYKRDSKQVEKVILMDGKEIWVKTKK